MNRQHTQSDYDVRFEWGLMGASAVAGTADVAVVVDVLSFTTTLTVAVDAGIDVLPYRFADDSARDVALREDAVLAVGRSAGTPGSISLSPATIDGSDHPRRLVLPSPNGSTIAHALASGSTLCIGASMRNAPAVGKWIADNSTVGDSVAMIAAGEKWPNGELRPCVEDLWGAGAVVAALLKYGYGGTLSPEATVAASSWSAVEHTVAESLRDCASGRELIALGFPRDVSIASAVDVSDCVPVMRNGWFTTPTARPQ